MFFLLLLVGVTVALPLQSQPEVQENLWDDIEDLDLQAIAPIIYSKRDGQDNSWDDIIQAALSVSTVIAKREFQANLCDIVKAIQAAQDLQYIGLPLNKREVLEDFCDDPFKAAFNDQIQYIGLPLEKREGQDNIWDDIIQAALSVSTVIAKREALDWSTVDINELLQIVGGGAPLITTLLEPARKRQLQIIDWNSIDWDAINAILNQPDVPIINAFLEKRQLIWNPLEPITDPIPPFILPAKKDAGTEDNLFDLLVDAIGVLAPVISAGKRNCLGDCGDILDIPEPVNLALILKAISEGRRDVEDNLWDDILQWAAEIAPVVNGPIGKRMLDPLPLDQLLGPSPFIQALLYGTAKKDVEDNLWDDILQWAAEIAPIVNGPILGKRLLDVDYNPDIPNPIQTVDPAIISWLNSLINTRDAEDNLLNDILQFYTEVAPLVNGPIMAGKRAIWWDGIIDPIIEPVLPILQALKRQIDVNSVVEQMDPDLLSYLISNLNYFGKRQE